MNLVVAFILFCALSFSEYFTCDAQHIPLNEEDLRPVTRDGYANVEILRSESNGEQQEDGWTAIHLPDIGNGEQIFVTVFNRVNSSKAPLDLAVARDDQKVDNDQKIQDQKVNDQEANDRKILGQNVNDEKVNDQRIVDQKDDNQEVVDQKDVPTSKDPLRPAEQACQKYQNQPTDYILGGNSTELGEFPWMAALGYLDIPSSYSISFECGGTLISDSFVLTSASCVRPSHPPVVVRMGTLSLNDTDDGKAMNHQIKEIIRHPSYSAQTRKNDIALVRLLDKVYFSDVISPACLQIDSRDVDSDVKMIVVGWGKSSSEGSSRSNELLQAELETVPLQQCNASYSKFNQLLNLPFLRDGISQSQYCAFDPERKTDSCQGDSGGPLQFFNESNSRIATVVGVVSFGVGCGSELPGIHTRVAHYLDWIESIVWPKSLQ